MTSVIRNSLLTVLLRDAPEWQDAPVEVVDLPFGPWTLEPSNPFVYFPIDALLTLSHGSAVHDAVDVAVVGQQPFGGARASGTNDKAGSLLNLYRWVSARTVKEVGNPPTNWRYPYLG